MLENPVGSFRLRTGGRTAREKLLQKIAAPKHDTAPLRNQIINQLLINFTKNILGLIIKQFKSYGPSIPKSAKTFCYPFDPRIQIQINLENRVPSQKGLVANASGKQTAFGEPDEGRTWPPR